MKKKIDKKRKQIGRQMREIVIKKRMNEKVTQNYRQIE